MANFDTPLGKAIYRDNFEPPEPPLTKCYSCDCSFDEDEITEINKMFFCDFCRDLEFVQCESCEDWFDRSCCHKKKYQTWLCDECNELEIDCAEANRRGVSLEVYWYGDRPR